MNCHQVLSGSCNVGDRTFAVGSVEGIPFTAYASGCNIVILAKNFERVQIIPGVVHVNCLDCSADTGKIAAAVGTKIVIYEAAPLIRRGNSHRLQYHWLQTNELEVKRRINVLTWNQVGSRLLVGGEKLYMWENHVEKKMALTKTVSKENGAREIKFNLEEDSNDGSDQFEEVETSYWECIWKTTPANPVFYLSYSSDGVLFATAGEYDRLVKIWFESTPTSPSVIKNESEFSSKCKLAFNYIYVSHPRAVCGIQWRKTSKYIPKVSVANMLITSCLDNITRLWVETILPNDERTKFNFLHPSGDELDGKGDVQRSRHGFLQRHKHLKTCFRFRRPHHAMETSKSTSVVARHSTNSATTPTKLPLVMNGDIEHTHVAIPSIFHFHLAATINAETDIPLIDPRHKHHQLMLHWLDNKDMQFTEDVEDILLELTKKAQDELENTELSEDSSIEGLIDGKVNANGDAQEVGGVTADTRKMTHFKHFFSRLVPSASSAHVSLSAPTALHSMATGNHRLAEDLDHKIEDLLKEWHQASDLLFAIHPADGSFLVWTIKYLDEYHPGSFRQAVVSFSMRIPNAVPLRDALSMSANVGLYSNHHFLDLKHALHLDILHSEDGERESVAETCEVDSLQEFSLGISPSVSVLFKHSNGTLNLWKISFTENSKYSDVRHVKHKFRACGHRYEVTALVAHPFLPLLLSTSNRKPSSADCEIGYCSELLLWQVEPIGPLSKKGGVTELAYISSKEQGAFSQVAWIPQSMSLSNHNEYSSLCFVVSDGGNLRIYEAILDPRFLLSEAPVAESNHKDGCSSSSSSTVSNDEYETSQFSPARIIELGFVKDSGMNWDPTFFFHVYPEQMFGVGESPSDSLNFYLVVVVNRDKKEANILMWKITLGSKIVAKDSYVGEDTVTSSGTQKRQYDTVTSIGTQKSQYDTRTSFLNRSGHYDTRTSSVNRSSHYDTRTSFLNRSDQYDTRTSSLNRSGQYDTHTSSLNRSGQYDTHTSSLNRSVEARIGSQQDGCQITVPITTTLVGSQHLSLPEGVSLTDVTPAVGHLSSASISLACNAPYLIISGSSDRCLRFWKCQRSSESFFVWSEWELVSQSDRQSSILLTGTPIKLAAAYCGRVAVLYEMSMRSFRACRYRVAIYECESTGGSEWILEDTIMLPDLKIPEKNMLLDLDLTLVRDHHLAEERHHALDLLLKSFTHEDLYVAGEDAPHCDMRECFQCILAVPSSSTLRKLRHILEEKEEGMAPSVLQKDLRIHLDWVSREDGSHILTIGYAGQISFFTPVSSDVAQMNMKTMKEHARDLRPTLIRTSSMAAAKFAHDEFTWMRLRQMVLQTADGVLPVPLQLSWARHGILVVGLDSEVRIFSQWRPSGAIEEDPVPEDTIKYRTLTEQNLRSFAKESVTTRRLAKGGRPSKSKSFHTGTEDTNRRSITSDDELPDFGLFEASRIVCPLLPQYHPKQLMELLNSGKIRRVRAILAHLVRCIEEAEKKNPVSTSVPSSEAERRKSRSGDSLELTYSDTASEVAAEAPVEEVEDPLDYVEISSLPPLSLWKLLLSDKEKGRSNEVDQDYTGLFGDDVDGKENEESLDDVLSEEPRERHPSISSRNRSDFTYFGPREANQLTHLLTHTHLPGLSSLDQMHLLALADTVASCNVDFADKFTDEEEQARAHQVTTGKALHESLDDCGLRFVLAMRHHVYLLRCLPPSQKISLHAKGIGPSAFVWAFHSESEEELLQLIPSYTKGDVTWAELRELGFGWWIRSPTLLRRCMEKVAKAAFTLKKDPLDAALYYIAMKKKSLVWGLFRSVRDERMVQFFANDFSEDRWRKAALKNAFALLGKQRFEHAVAFFLLGNSLHDAVEVCISKLNDMQLAMVVCRLFDGDLGAVPESLRRLLRENILGFNAQGKEHTENAHPDSFLRSMAHWMLKDYGTSLNTLLLTNIGSSHPAILEDTPTNPGVPDPAVFNFYIYLRTHPMLLRHLLTTQERPSAGISDLQNVSSENSFSPMERRMYFTTAHAHFRAGCPALALEILSKLPGMPKICASGMLIQSDLERRNSSQLIETGMLKSPKKEEPVMEVASAVSWDTPEVRKEEELVLDWEDDKPEVVDDEEESVSDSPKSEGREAGVSWLDVMAQQLKYIACLQILLEELPTLVTSSETGPDDQIRYHLYVWLERIVDALRELSCYDTCSESAGNEEGALGYIVPSLSSESFSDKQTLNEILQSEKLPVEEKIQLYKKRRAWLVRNELFLRTLHSYCVLYGTSDDGLSVVETELTHLLQELPLEHGQSPLHFLQEPPQPDVQSPQKRGSIIGISGLNDATRSVRTWVRDLLMSVDK